MTQQVINIGAAPDDHTGDPIRTSFDKTNQNFTELYAKPSGGGSIAAGTTPTSGFTAGQILMSDGATAQAMTYGATMNWGSAAAPLMVSSEAGTPGMLTFTAQQSGYPTAFGIALRLPGAFPGAGSFGVQVSYGGYVGLNNLSNWMDGAPDFAMSSDANEAGRGDFRSISNPAQPVDLRAYNIYTSSIDGEWGGFDWKTVPNTLTIGAHAQGSGVLRPVNIVGSSVTVNGSPIPVASSSSPLMDGTAAAGSSALYSRGDHAHPSDTSRLALAGGVMTGALTISQTAGIVGTTTNNNAAAGALGEVISNNITSGVSMTSSGTATSVTNVSLTAGDWDVSGEVWITAGATAPTVMNAAINTSVALPASSGVGTSRTMLTLAFVASALQILPLKTCRLSLASTTTVSLIAAVTYASGAAPTATGNIIARRAR